MSNSSIQNYNPRYTGREYLCSLCERSRAFVQSPAAGNRAGSYQLTAEEFSQILFDRNVQKWHGSEKLINWGFEPTFKGYLEFLLDKKTKCDCEDCANDLIVGFSYIFQKKYLSLSVGERDGLLQTFITTDNMVLLYRCFESGRVSSEEYLNKFLDLILCLLTPGCNDLVKGPQESRICSFDFGKEWSPEERLIDMLQKISISQLVKKEEHYRKLFFVAYYLGGFYREGESKYWWKLNQKTVRDIYVQLFLRKEIAQIGDLSKKRAMKIIFFELMLAAIKEGIFGLWAKSEIQTFFECIGFLCNDGDESVVIAIVNKIWSFAGNNESLEVYSSKRLDTVIGILSRMCSFKSPLIEKRPQCDISSLDLSKKALSAMHSSVGSVLTTRGQDENFMTRKQKNLLEELKGYLEKKIKKNSH